MLGLICFTVLMVNATPVMILREKLRLLNIKKDNSFIRNKVIELLSCAMCLGFWIGFLFFIFSNTFIFSILLASIISIFSELLQKLIRY